MRLTTGYRDEAIRTLPLWLVHSSVTGSVLVGMVVFAHTATGRLPIPAQGALSLCGWFLIVTWLLLGRIRTRCSELDLSLPIPARGLWLSHLVAVLMAGGAILAAAGAVLAAHALLLVRVPGSLVSELNGWSLAAHLGAGTALAVTLLQSRRTGDQSVPLDREHVLWVLVVGAGVGGLVTVLSLVPAVWALLPLGLAVAVGAYSYRSVPQVLSAMGSGDEEAPGDSRVPKAWEAGASRAGSLLFLRIVYYSPKLGQATPLVTVPFLALMGAVLGGALGKWTGEDMLAYMYIPLVSMMLLSFIAPLVEMLPPLDPLPLSRRRIFAFLTLPSLAVVALSYAVGWALPDRGEGPREYVQYREHRNDKHFYLYVPIGRDDVSWAGDAPDTVAPWGETHPAWQGRPFKGSPIVVYSPFHTPPGSSLDFVAWQISRAAERVYGVSISPQEIASAYLKERPDGSVGLKKDRLTLRADRPGLDPLRLGPVFPVMMTLAVVPFFLGLAVVLRFFRSGYSERFRKGLLFAFIGLAVAVMLLQGIGMIGGFSAPWAFQVLVEMSTRRIGASVLGVLATWFVSAVLLFLSYRVAESFFVRAELPATPGGGGIG